LTNNDGKINQLMMLFKNGSKCLHFEIVCKDILSSGKTKFYMNLTGKTILNKKYNFKTAALANTQSKLLAAGCIISSVCIG
jgi:hypothetical protein